MNNNNRRRGRGNNNNRQQGGQQLNRVDSRARGNAPQMLEKYRKLAHDSHLNGDRVTEEYYLQFADHYFRVIADQRVRQEEQRQPRPAGANERPSEYGDDYAEDDFYGDANSPYDRAGNYAPSMQNNSQAGHNQSANGQGNGGTQNQGARGNDGQGNDVQGQDGRGNDNRSQDNRTQDSRGNDNRGNDSRSSDHRGNGQSGGYQNNAMQGGNGGEGQSNGNANEGRGRRNDRQNRREQPDRVVRSEAPMAVESTGDIGRNDAVEGIAQTSGAQDVAAADASAPSVYEPAENPFVRSDRAPRTPRARKPRREEAPQTAAASAELPLEPVKQDEPPANLDLSSLPPAISRRDQADETEAAPAKPKRRTRRAAPPAEDAGGTLETVN